MNSSLLLASFCLFVLDLREQSLPKTKLSVLVRKPIAADVALAGSPVPPPFPWCHSFSLESSPSLRSLLNSLLRLRKCRRQHFQPRGLFLDPRISLHIHNTCHSIRSEKDKSPSTLNYLLFVAPLDFHKVYIYNIGHQCFIFRSSPLHVSDMAAAFT